MNRLPIEKRVQIVTMLVEGQALARVVAELGRGECALQHVRRPTHRAPFSFPSSPR